MIGSYATTTAVLRTPVRDKFGSITQWQEVTVTGHLEHGVKTIRTVGGAMGLAALTFRCANRAVSVDARVKIDDVEYGIVGIERPKAFTHGHLVLRLA